MSEPKSKNNELRVRERRDGWREVSQFLTNVKMVRIQVDDESLRGCCGFGTTRVGSEKVSTDDGSYSCAVRGAKWPGRKVWLSADKTQRIALFSSRRDIGRYHWNSSGSRVKTSVTYKEL